MWLKFCVKYEVQIEKQYSVLFMVTFWFCAFGADKRHDVKE